MTVLSKKICMVGDFGVGKTSLVRQFVDHQFSDHYLSTIGVKISRKLITDPDLRTPDLQLMIWDIEGRTEFQAVTPHYLAGAMAAIIVADPHRPETIAHIVTHIQLLTAVNHPNLPMMIALNKVDTLSPKHQAELEIQAQQALSIWQSYAKVLTAFCTSAKTGESVDHLFKGIAKFLLSSSA
jgi:small GTP-binding protein